MLLTENCVCFFATTKLKPHFGEKKAQKFGRDKIFLDFLGYNFHPQKGDEEEEDVGSLFAVFTCFLLFSR